MTVNTIGSTTSTTQSSGMPSAEKSSTPSENKVKMSEKSTTNADGSVTVTITYSDGSTQTITEPGDSASVSSSKSK